VNKTTGHFFCAVTEIVTQNCGRRHSTDSHGSVGGGGRTTGKDSDDELKFSEAYGNPLR
jgi:hypothetical protein